ncbi:hypothetical protein AOQ84DRAFT_385671 [Glonium stellatum]|uniref:Uncharacterized protein n=1 Tax=Glonium stellatum TaxID=574774 RepID=A0A8E2FA35_9PEZI|nr:hypothetical protein AOQ84DRAFT_385671 [Glonium stellatum]
MNCFLGIAFIATLCVPTLAIGPRQPIPTTASSVSAVSSPTPPCDFPVFTSTNLTWFNSTHNLDCGPDVANGTVCIGDVCNIPLCDTGVPPLFNDAPLGYGPPDWLYLSISNDPVPGGPCNISSLNGLQPYTPIGGGDYLKCGSTGRPVQFWGDSNSAVGWGNISFSRTISCGDRRIDISAAHFFKILCTHDEGFNATCVSDPRVFEIPIQEWSYE